MYHSIWARKLDEKYERKVIETADFTIVVSKSIKKLFEHKFPGINKNRVHVIPNGYDETDFNLLLQNPLS
ncbi:MAG: glycosyltransferase family 4 protein [Bacteroidota bacterium]|nr:glycosyltransferase family 4 protein [Bacteroidota bacterium]